MKKRNFSLIDSLKNQGFSLIEFLMLGGLMLALLVFTVLMSITPKGDNRTNVNEEIVHINKALLMLSNKPLVMDNVEINEQILTKAGFKFVKEGRQFKGDFNNTITIVEFPSAGVKSSYTYRQYERFVDLYNEEEFEGKYKVSSECEYYKLDVCDVTFTSKSLSF